MEIINLPDPIKKIIQNDEIDFITKAETNSPISKSLLLLFFGFAWAAISSLFIQMFTEPLFVSKPIAVPGLVIGLFFIIGVGIFISGINSLFQKGGYFIGSNKWLVKFRKGKIEYTDWSKFSQKIDIKVKNGLGNIEFTLNTFKKEISPDFDRKYNTSNQISYDKIFIIGVEDVYEIERKCRQRIAENIKNHKK